MVKLRSIEISFPGVADAAAFLTGHWGMAPAETRGSSIYLRGSGGDPYLIALHEEGSNAVDSVTFTADDAEIERISKDAAAAGAKVERVDANGDPGGGQGILVTLPEGERLRFLTGTSTVPAIDAPDMPVRLTHVVMNSVDAEATAAFVEEALGFRVSDRTKGMVFVRCNDSHHSVAFARAGVATLNHIAFEMEDTDAVMRGVGRMRDIGLPVAWGPGRHGPGDNVFAYFIAPFGPVIEYSTAVEKIGPDYPTGNPEDWTWPPNRIDKWGLSDKDFAGLAEAERRFLFRGTSI